MNHRHTLSLIAGGATMLAALPLMTVFASFTWMFYTGIAVGVIIGTAMLVRSARGPVWAQVLAMMASLLLYLTLVFPSGDEFFRLIPTGATFRHFNDLLADAGIQIRENAAPVPDLEGLLLLTTAGVGMVAVLVDLAAVGIRRPALAGLPMLAIYSVPVAVLPEGLSVVPFGFAAAGYLWLLISDSVDRVRRFGRRFTGDGRDVDVWEPSPLSSAGRRLGVVSVIIAMLVPFAVPGMTTSLFDQFNPGNGLGGPGGTGGQGASVNLSALLKDNLQRQETFEMVRLTTTDPSPAYLRFAVADQVSPQGFMNYAPASGTAVNRGLPPPFVPESLVSKAKSYTANVNAVNFNMQLVPVFDQVTAIRGLANGWLYDADTHQIFARPNGPNINRQQYQFEFTHLDFTPAALRTAPPLGGTDTAARQQSFVPPIQQITDMVTTLTAGKTNEYDRVRALKDYLTPRNGFSYTLQTVPGSSGNDIVDFLATKKGFCVQYAAALAWLVRAAGYPARVAFGFTHGTGPSNGGYSFTNLNLHAWTEVFFPEFGWVWFDATPTGSVIGTLQPEWSDSEVPIAEGSEPPDVGNPRGPGAEPSSTAPPIDPGAAGGPTDGPAAIDNWVLVFAAAVAFLIAMLIVPSLIRRNLRRRRRTISGRTIEIRTDHGLPALELVSDVADIEPARRDAHAAWSELLDTMIDYEVLVDEAETPRATADRLATLPALDPAAGGQARILASAEERARYAKAPLRADGLDAAVRVTREALARRATRMQRIRATFLPPSVLLRWRNAYVGWVNQSSRRMARIRESMLTLSPRRLLTRDR